VTAIEYVLILHARHKTAHSAIIGYGKNKKIAL